MKSFSINGKSQSKRPKKPSTAAAGADDAADSPAIKYVSEFRADEAPPPESQIKAIAPLPNAWRANKKLKNLQSLPQISQANGEDAGLQFELDTSATPEPGDTSTGYGLNLRQPSANGGDVTNNGKHETISDMELRKLREDLGNLPDGPGLDEFEDVPVEGFGLALLSGYGWKEGRGIGRNAKGDVTVAEVTKKRGRGGLGFSDEMPEPENRNNNANGNAVETVSNGSGRDEKAKVRKVKDTAGFVEEKEVMIVNGREMGMKGKILEVRNGGDLLIVRMLKSHEKVKVRRSDVVEVGSADEEKFLRKFKELRVKNGTVKDTKERRISESSHKRVEARSERVNWLRNHIRVRVISQELKRGRLYLKKGVVVDVVGPGVCDVSIDETRELVQGVDQDFLETALPKRGGPVLVLCGRHKGVYGNLLERDSEKETGVIRDADSHELLSVKLEQAAEYTGDPSDIGY